MNKLLIQNLRFSYLPGEEILRGMTLELDGRPTAIIGQNGAGKTTFAKLLKGLLRPTEGAIYFNGRDIASQTVAQLSREIGLVFQNPNDQIFKNTVLEEVMFGPLQIGMSPQEAERASRSALELVGLLEQISVNPYDLGLSDRKMVSIASIVAMDPSVIIFDEPTIAQDYSGKERIKKIMASLTAQGKIVLSILHDMDFVAEAFDRVIVVAQGDILLDGSPKDVFSAREMLACAYVEEPNVTQLCRELGYEDICLNVDDFIELHKRQTKL